MTVHVQESSVSYTGNGSQTVYPFNFKIFTDDNLKVYVDNVLQVIVTDYTNTNNGDETGGEVTFITAPAAGSEILVERILKFQQLLDLIEYDRFPAESVESALDYIVMLTQQNDDAIGRALKADPDMPTDVDLVVPVPGAGQFFKYSDDGKGIETADINELGTQIVPTMTDAEITNGTGTQTRLISASQVKLGVQTHETVPITSVFDVAWVSVVDTLPATPNPNTMYLVRNA